MRSISECAEQALNDRQEVCVYSIFDLHLDISVVALVKAVLTCASEDICDRSHSLIFILSDGMPGGRWGSICSYTEMSLVLEALSFITPGPLGLWVHPQRLCILQLFGWIQCWVLMMAESDTQSENSSVQASDHNFDLTDSSFQWYEHLCTNRNLTDHIDAQFITVCYSIHSKVWQIPLQEPIRP